MSFAILGRPIRTTGSPATCQHPPMKQPTEPAPNTARRNESAPAAIGSDALVRQPQTLRRQPGLPEDVDRHSAARIPVAADPQPAGLHLLAEPLADPDRHVLVEAAMVPERSEEQLQAF